MKDIIASLESQLIDLKFDYSNQYSENMTELYFDIIKLETAIMNLKSLHTKL